jgi:hypothetical protein
MGTLLRYFGPFQLDSGWVQSTMAGDVTLAYDADQFRRYDPDGSNRTITLPEAISAHYGITFVIAHIGTANTIAVSDGSTILTLNAGDVALFQCFDAAGTSDWSANRITSGGTASADVISEVTSGAGVTVDGVLLKDSQVTTDVILEKTSTAGVTADGLRIKDAAINPVAGGAAFIDLSNVATGEADVILNDNLAIALEIREAANSYLIFKTTNDAERITLGKIVATVQTTVDMADAAHTLVLTTAAANETKILGNVLVVDPNSGGAAEDLQLPAAASLAGVELTIINSGGEGIVVLGEAAATVITLDTAQHGKVYSTGSAWIGFMGGVT